MIAADGRTVLDEIFNHDLQNANLPITQPNLTPSSLIAFDIQFITNNHSPAYLRAYSHYGKQEGSMGFQFG